MKILHVWIKLTLFLCCFVQSKNKHSDTDHFDLSSFNTSELIGKVVKGNRNALFLVEVGERSMLLKRQFPDFYTFQSMGYNSTDVRKIPDAVLHSLPLGTTIKSIPAPPPFRPDDYMYHTQCEDPDRMINELGLIPNMGNYLSYTGVLNRVKARKHIDILALGGSITAGGYFLEFARLLRDTLNINTTIHNHGHGATEITYSIFCVDIDKNQPDLVLIDFSVNDYGHPKLMDGLLRKVSSLSSNPIIVLVNLWVHTNCPPTRYLTHSFYYQIPIINICPAANLCFGRGRLPKYVSDQYSLTDGVHPWGVKGVKFISDIIFAWWKRLNQLVFELQDVNGHIDHKPNPLPSPMYKDSPIGTCTRCEALADDADAVLKPVGSSKGFRVVTRVKIGYGGFNPSDKSKATKSFKRSWQAEKPGSEISFKFYGSTVKIAIWQRRDSMGVLHAYVDGDKSKIAIASGFFPGYTWAMERNNTGRSEIIPLFEGLPDKEHILTLVVSEKPANPWVIGHTCQIFALLAASNDPSCKNISFSG
eukprot:gene11763-15740_t